MTLRADPGVLAAAGALALVAISSVALPLLPEEFAGWADAIINEWIIWFAALYVALLTGEAVIERISSWDTRRRSLGGNDGDDRHTSPSGGRV